MTQCCKFILFHSYKQQRELNSRWTTKSTHSWMNQKISNKECSFKRFMLVKYLVNTLHFTKHDSYLYDCSWTNCSLIHVNKKNPHHREIYVFIWTNNFIELRFSTNDCRMCDCSNILQSSIIWIHLDVTWEFILENIFFFSKSLTMTRIEFAKSLKKNKSLVIISKLSVILNLTCRIESTCNNSIKSARFFLKQ